MVGQTWLDLARDNRKAASELVAAGRFRSATSRAYYAAYSKISHELVMGGQAMPVGREGPSHRKLRPMVEANLPSLEQSKRVALSRIIGRLYVLRVYADYSPSMTVDARDAREAVSLMNKVFFVF